MTDREIILWDCNEEKEQLSHLELDDAIEAAIEPWLERGMTREQFLAQLDEALGPTINVHGFARSEMPTFERLLDKLMDWLDIDLELGSPDGPDEPSEGLKAAARTFHEALLREYTPWSCEPVTTEEVNLREWIEKHPEVLPK